MKRDWDVVRAIFEQAGERLPGRDFVPSIKGVEDGVVYSHVSLMIDAGLLDGSVLKVESRRVQRAVISEITWAGNDLWDSIRHETVWKRLQAKMAEVGGDLPMAVVKSLAIGYAKDMVGLGSGE